jgi:hypothetical protein
MYVMRVAGVKYLDTSPRGMHYRSVVAKTLTTPCPGAYSRLNDCIRLRKKLAFSLVLWDAILRSGLTTASAPCGLPPRCRSPELPRLEVPPANCSEQAALSRDAF